MKFHVMISVADKPYVLLSVCADLTGYIEWLGVSSISSKTSRNTPLHIGPRKATCAASRHAETTGSDRASKTNFHTKAPGRNRARRALEG
jgi:hypothetical protein